MVGINSQEKTGGEFMGDNPFPKQERVIQKKPYKIDTCFINSFGLFIYCDVYEHNIK